MSDGPDVYSAGGARKVLGGISRQRFHQLASKPDFPTYRQLEIGRVWDGAEIRAWAISRNGAPLAGRKVLKALYAYRERGVLADAARAGGVAQSTATRWMRQIGVLDD